MQDEILVKGKDGKLYILKEDGLVPYETGTSAFSRFYDQPKGVEREAHERLEGARVEKVAEVVKATPPSPPLPKGGKIGSVSHEEHPLKVELEEVVEELIKNVKLKIQNVGWLEDPVLLKRFRMIVSARLRDVRDRNETMEMLMRNQRIGGLGISELETAKVVEIIEKAFAEFQQKWRAAEDKKRQAWVRVQRDKQDQQDKQKQKREEVDLEERYKRLIGVNPKSEIRNPKEIPKSKTQTLEAPGQPKVQIQKTTAQATFTPSTTSTPPKPLLMPPPPMVVKVQGGEVTSPRPPLSKGGKERSSSLPAQAGQPLAVSSKPMKITDVRKPPQLLGPMEELSALTLPDFRRLAKDPREGTAKILGKIEFLGKESLVRKTQAKGAWYKSPLYQEYSQIMRKAFAERKGPLAILESGQSTLTKDEWYAIMELNQKLRF